MATNAGAIKYTVEAETGGILNAEKVVDKATERMSKDFKKVDNAVKNTDKTIDKASKGIKSSSAKMTKSAAGVNKGVASMGRASGQAGIQFQQFIGQIQGGQSPMLALSQQSADLGFVLGAPLLGAVVGITSSLVGMLMPALFDSETTMDKLEKAVERVKAVMTVGADQVVNYSDKMKELASISKTLLQVKLRTTIQEQEQAFKLGAKALQEYTRDVTSFTNIFGSFAASVKDITGKDLGGKGFDEAKSALILFKKEVAIFNARPAADTVESLVFAIENLEKSGAGATEKGRKLLALASDQVVAFKQGKESIKSLNLALEDNAEVTETLSKKNTELKSAAKSLSESLDDQIRSLKSQSIAFNEGEEAAFRWSLRQQMGMKDTDEFTASVDERITSIFKLKAAQDKASEDKAATKSLTGQVQSIGLTQEESVVEKFKKDLELLRQAEEQKIEVIGTYEERRIELRRQAEERIAGINKKGTEDAILNFESLENRAIGTFAGIASGAMDGKEAIHSLAQSVLTEMIGSLISLGIQHVATAAMETTAEVTGTGVKASAAIAATTAITTAGVAAAGTLAAAWAPAAALVSLATVGSNAPLASAGILATTAVAEGVALAGGRQFGGPVTQGNNYRVNEGGKPEVLSSGGKDYLMNSPGGNVKQMDEVGGGGATTININNMASGVDVQASTSNDGRTIEIAVRKAVAEMTNQVASGNGAFIRALKSGTNVTTKAGR